MKKVILFFVCLIVSVSCQKRQFSASIPAPKFEHYHEDYPIEVKEKRSLEIDLEKKENVDFLSMSTVENVTQETKKENKTYPVYEPESEIKSSYLKATSLKKVTLKERIVNKIIAQKIKKTNKKKGNNVAEEKTNIVALISGIAALLGILLLLTASGSFTLLLALAGIIGGFIGRAQIKKTGEKGKGWALTGIFGGFAILLFYLLIVVVLAAILL